MNDIWALPSRNTEWGKEADLSAGKLCIRSFLRARGGSYWLHPKNWAKTLQQRGHVAKVLRDDIFSAGESMEEHSKIINRMDRASRHKRMCMFRNTESSGWLQWLWQQLQNTVPWCSECKVIKKFFSKSDCILFKLLLTTAIEKFNIALFCSSLSLGFYQNFGPRKDGVGEGCLLSPHGAH